MNDLETVVETVAPTSRGRPSILQRTAVFVRALLAGGCIALLFGCVSAGKRDLATQQKEANTLVTAVRTLTQAESDLYDQIIAISAARQKLALERAFVDHNDLAHIKELYSAEPPENYSKAKAVRLRLLSQLGSYAEQINAIAGDESTGWPAAQASAIEKDTGTLVTTIYKGVKIPTQATTSVGIINSIGQAVIAAKSAKEVSQLAASVWAAFDQLQLVIKQDDEIIDQGVVEGLIGAQQIDAQEILTTLYLEADSSAEPASKRCKRPQDRSPDWSPITERLDRLANMASVSAFLATFAATPTESPKILQAKQKAVDDAVSKIVAVNKALATKQSASELIDEAVAAATQAGADKSTSKTGKSSTSGSHTNSEKPESSP